jgi:xanthine dehydrogenase accessory factor
MSTVLGPAGADIGEVPYQDPLSMAALLKRDRNAFALAIVVDAVGSTSARTGAKAIFDREGTLLGGWIGGGCAESTVAHATIESMECGCPQIVEVDLNDEVLGAGMPCGGSMKVYVEPVLPRPTIWILGHGRLAECVCQIGALMGFEVVVDDPGATATQFPSADRIISDDVDYQQLVPHEQDFVVIATQHRGDHQSLRRVLATDVKYVALVASRKRTGLVLDYLRESGFHDSAISRIRAPCGLQLGARTPEEIALSVVSEIVLVRRGREAPAGLSNSPREYRAEPVSLSIAAAG